MPETGTNFPLQISIADDLNRACSLRLNDDDRTANTMRAVIVHCVLRNRNGKRPRTGGRLGSKRCPVRLHVFLRCHLVAHKAGRGKRGPHEWCSGQLRAPCSSRAETRQQKGGECQSDEQADNDLHLNNRLWLLANGQASVAMPRHHYTTCHQTHARFCLQQTALAGRTPSALATSGALWPNPPAADSCLARNLVRERHDQNQKLV
jgi:hypothetical protein